MSMYDMHALQSSRANKQQEHARPADNAGVQATQAAGSKQCKHAWQAFIAAAAQTDTSAIMQQAGTMYTAANMHTAVGKHTVASASTEPTMHAPLT